MKVKPNIITIWFSNVASLFHTENITMFVIDSYLWMVWKQFYYFSTQFYDIKSVCDDWI